MKSVLIVLLSITTLLPLKTQAVAYLTSVDSLPLTIISQEECAEKQKALRAQHCIQHPTSNISQFEFDAASNLSSADNGSVSNSFVYDNMNRLVGSGVRWQESGVNFQTDYRYDLGGLVTNIVYPGNKTLYYAYDTDGRLTSVTDWNNRTFTITRDAAGRMTALAYPNGVSGAYSYDASHALTSWSFTKSGSPIAGRTINRDAAGHKTSESVTSGLFPNPTQPRRASNTFDAADRLTSAIVHSGTNTFNETYRYNANGALTNCVSALTPSTPSSSLISKTYSYDLAGRFTSINSQLSILNYQFAISYDALGNRVRTVTDGTARLWVTDHADPLKRPLMETDVSGTPVRYYIWGGGTLLAVVEADGTTHYAHSDEQGSIVVLTDSTGTITDQYCYGPYGSDWGHSGTNSIPFRWLGSHGVFAATPNPSSSLTPSPCLYLTRYRAYDAYTGRFLSSDPLGLGGGPNLHAYCLGNPLSYIDPLGLCGESVGNIDPLLGLGTLQYNPNQMVLRAAGPSAGSDNTDIMHDPSSDPDSRAIQHANTLIPEGAIGTSFGDRMMEDIGFQFLTAPGFAVIAEGIAGAVGRALAPRTTSTTLSPFRNTRVGETFQHYSSVQHADSLAGGLRPGGYATTTRGLTGAQAQSGLALPHPTPPNAVYTVSPPAGTPIRVNPITVPQFGQPGGLPEVQFILGTPPGSISGPTLIP